jgi:hypothetical protein
MNDNSFALWMILAATVCGGFCGWHLHLFFARHNAHLTQLLKQGKRPENLFKPEYDRIMAMPSQLNDHQGWLAMARLVML